jgi:hypothetical protein
MYKYQIITVFVNITKDFAQTNDGLIKSRNMQLLLGSLFLIYLVFYGQLPVVYILDSTN